MEILRNLPKIDKFVHHQEFKDLPIKMVTEISKEVIDTTRSKILNKEITSFEESELIKEVAQKTKDLLKPSLQPLINATGVIVHTNLGRSPIKKEILENVLDVASSYNNLEYDLAEGKRGERYSHVTKLITYLTGAEDALVVNNNASAVFLILNTFAQKKEVVVSRGELVEIGGSFRVPDVMRESGAILKEVGTTNKTHLKDYDSACEENTVMFMKVHKSNYSIEGFTSEVDLKEISKLGKEKNVFSYYDMGGGHLIDLPFALEQHEPSLLEVLKTGVDLVSFSGDKLLGSIQGGIIVGSKELIAKLKKNQLLRMLRVDKITLAIIEESLRVYAKDELKDIAILELLLRTEEELEKLAKDLQQTLEDLNIDIIKTKTVIGGGTTPNRKIPSIALHITYKNYKPNRLEEIFREKLVIGRIEDGKFLLDLRSVMEKDLEKLVAIIKEVSNA